MKKTLRMGDLLHLDDSVRKRLETMVDSKNLVMEGSYNADPISVDEMWAWLEKYAAIFKDYICDGRRLPRRGRPCGQQKNPLEAQLGALRDVDFASIPTPPPPTSSAPTPPSARASPAASWTIPSAS